MLGLINTSESLNLWKCIERKRWSEFIVLLTINMNNLSLCSLSAMNFPQNSAYVPTPS